MHVFVVFVDLLSVRLRCETSQAFLEYVDTHGLIGGDEDVNAEIELMAINEEGVGDVFTND